MKGLGSGSGLERAMVCDGSLVFPRVFDAIGTEDRTRGTVAHAYLERISEGMTPAESLAAIDPADVQHAEACRAIDTVAIRDLLALDHEVSFAYRPSDGTARILGRALGRDYAGAGLREDEIPLTIDVVGVNRAERRAFFADYKSGWAKLPPVRDNWQMRGAALAIAGALDVDYLDGQLIFLREGQAVRRDVDAFEPADILEIGELVRARWNRAEELRAAWASGEMPDVTRGTWCKYCPSRHVCPAFTALVRSIVAPDTASPLALTRLDPGALGDAFRLVKAAEKAIAEVKTQIYAAANAAPILVEIQPDGSELWLGMTSVEGHDVLDADKAVDALLETLFEPEQREAERLELLTQITKRTVTKKAIDGAIKMNVPRGKGVATTRAFEAKLRELGGITTKTTEKVALYTVAPPSKRLA